MRGCDKQREAVQMERRFAPSFAVGTRGWFCALQRRSAPHCIAAVAPTVVTVGSACISSAPVPRADTT